MYKTTTAVFIAILLGYILYLTQCKKVQPVTVTRTTVKVVKDSSGWIKPKPTDSLKPRFIRVEVPGAPVPIFKDTGSIRYRPVYITQPVDTQAILEHYFSVYYYVDSFSTKHVKVRVKDTVTKNQIIARKWETELTLPPLKNYHEIYLEGGGYNSKTELISGAHLSLGYINLKRQHFKVNVLYMNNRLHRGVSFAQTLGKW